MLPFFPATILRSDTGGSPPPVPVDLITPHGAAASASGTVSESSIYSTSAGWKAFDGDPGSCWTAAGAWPRWLAYEFAAPRTVTRYWVYVHNVTTQRPTAWTFEGSDDGATWTVLDARSGIAWSLYETKWFDVSAPRSFKRYRFAFTAMSGGTYINIFGAGMWGY